MTVCVCTFVYSFVDFGFVFVCFMWDGETCTDPKCVMCEMRDLGCVVSEVCGTQMRGMRVVLFVNFGACVMFLESISCDCAVICAISRVDFGM